MMDILQSFVNLSNISHNSRLPCATRGKSESTSDHVASPISGKIEDKFFGMKLNFSLYKSPSAHLQNSPSTHCQCQRRKPERCISRGSCLKERLEWSIQLSAITSPANRKRSRQLLLPPFHSHATANSSSSSTTSPLLLLPACFVR